jgi:hypothetical protein
MRYGPRLQLRWQDVSCVEQLVWQAVGLDVTPTLDIDGMMVVPVAALGMQVFWHACSWLVQPKLQVCDVTVAFGKMTGDGA